jgi:Eukaryotic protein of unknown function (DUF846)
MNPEPFHQPRTLMSAIDISKASHPFAAFFHILWKGLAIASYFFAGVLFSNGSTYKTLLVIIFSSFDFWTVKNITGR